MITKEQNINKKCLFCVSDYHLEMILLPYIIEKKDEFKAIVFTESNLEESINVLLTKVILKEEDKKIIKNIDWNKNDSLKFEQIEEIKDNKLNIIINGSYEYIKIINKKLEGIINKNTEIVDCFHIGSQDINASELSKKYNCILNTKKI